MAGLVLLVSAIEERSPNVIVVVGGVVAAIRAVREVDTLVRLSLIHI